MAGTGEPGAKQVCGKAALCGVGFGSVIRGSGGRLRLQNLLPATCGVRNRDTPLGIDNPRVDARRAAKPFPGAGTAAAPTIYPADRPVYR